MTEEITWTDAEREAQFNVEHVHHVHGADCRCGFSSSRSRSRTEHITGTLMDALAPLVAERVRQARAEAALAAPEVAAALHALAGTTVHTGQSIENAARMLADVIRADAEGGQP